jgi:hypothetical protein
MPGMCGGREGESLFYYYRFIIDGEYDDDIL